MLWSSGISQKSEGLIVRCSQKKEQISFVFYRSENPSIAHNFGITGPIQVGVSAKCTSPNKHFNQIENWKCHMFDFRLISLITSHYFVQNVFFYSSSIHRHSHIKRFTVHYKPFCPLWRITHCSKGPTSFLKIQKPFGECYWGSKRLC